MLDRKVTQYKPEHYHEIAGWFVKRRLKVPPMWGLSDTGYIIHGVAAGFLYLTNSGIGYIDCLIANPEASKDDRNNGIDSIIRRVISQAHASYNVKMLCCSSSIKAVQKRARFFKFIDTGTFIGFTKEL